MKTFQQFMEDVGPGGLGPGGPSPGVHRSTDEYVEIHVTHHKGKRKVTHHVATRLGGHWIAGGYGGGIVGGNFARACDHVASGGGVPAAGGATAGGTPPSPVA